MFGADAVAALPVLPLGRSGAVTHRVLWQRDTAMAGVLHVPAGEHLGVHAHRTNHHHVWIVDGHAVIVGEHLGPGSYAHIPGGCDHDIDARATEGCSVFYLYLPPSE